MNEIILREQVRAQYAIAEAFENLIERMRREDGQTSVEYVGVIVVVAALILAFKGQIGSVVGGLVGKISSTISGL